MAVDSRLFDHDPITGVTEMFHYDDVTDTVTLELIQRVDERVYQAQYNAHSDHKATAWKGDWHKVASIPLVVYEDLRRQGIVDDDAAFKRWLNDRDNRVFRTKPGHV